MTIDRVCRIADLAHDKYRTEPLKFYRVMCRAWRDKKVGAQMARATTEELYRDQIAANRERFGRLVASVFD